MLLAQSTLGTWIWIYILFYSSKLKKQCVLNAMHQDSETGKVQRQFKALEAESESGCVQIKDEHCIRTSINAQSTLGTWIWIYIDLQNGTQGQKAMLTKCKIFIDW